MSLQKTLCVICERPTVDGAVHVDKDKLQTWFLNVCEHELAEEIEDEDEICCFCLWHAEFLSKFDEMADDALVWWPRNLDYFDDALKELRNYYFEGRLEQCWVQLEKIELPKSADDEERRIDEGEMQQRQWKCIYCGKRFKYSNVMSKHVKKMHKDAIRCDNYNCATYFHTLEEKEEHNKNVHEKSQEREKFNCTFCEKEFEGPQNYNIHVRRAHKEFPVKCSHRGCLSFFKTKIEMKTHFDSAHEKDDMTRKFRCNDCDYKTMKKSHLEAHIARKHLLKSMKCKMCDNLFSDRYELKNHEDRSHNFEVCPLCKLALSVYNKKYCHLKITKCNRCKSKFRCLGLYKSHLKSCKNRTN